MLRSIIIHFDSCLLAECEDSLNGVHVKLQEAVEAIRAAVPSVVIGRVFPTAGSVSVRAPQSSLSDLDSFLAEEGLGSYEFDEGHSFTGA